MTAVHRLSRLCCLLLFASCLAACGPAPDQSAAVQVTEARIRVPVPGQDKTAAYLTIENGSKTPFVLTAIESAGARAIEMHTIDRDGDTVRMRRLPEVVVEPGATVTFAPGGLHLMIFGVTEPIDPFTATLVAADGRRLEVSFATLALGGN